MMVLVGGGGPLERVFVYGDEVSWCWCKMLRKALGFLGGQGFVCWNV